MAKGKKPLFWEDLKKPWQDIIQVGWELIDNFISIFGIKGGKTRKEYQNIYDKCNGIDHPALWIGENNVSEMDGVEAYFSMNPEILFEESLNRYRVIDRFGSFSIGMIRF